MKLKKKKLKVFDVNAKLIFGSNSVNNKTFKIMINMLDHQSLTSIVTYDMKMGYMKKMVYGLSRIKMQKQLCEE